MLFLLDTTTFSDLMREHPTIFCMLFTTSLLASDLPNGSKLCPSRIWPEMSNNIGYRSNAIKR